MPKMNKATQKARNAIAKRLEAEKTRPIKNTRRIQKMRFSKTLKRSERDDQNQILDDIDKILEGKPTSIGCPHYLVGASSFHWLARGRYNMTCAHAHLKSFEQTINSQSWKAGEKTTEADFEGSYRQAFRVHPYIPFLCAKCDVLLEDEHATVEVKTSSQQEHIDSFNRLIPRRHLCQIIMTMECFGIEKSKLDVYQFFFGTGSIKDGGRVLDYSHGWFRRAHRQKIYKTVSFFDRRFLQYIVERYVVFLAGYFRASGLFMATTTKRTAETKILQKIVCLQDAYQEDVKKAKLIAEEERAKKGEKARNFNQILNHGESPIPAYAKKSIREEIITNICERFKAVPPETPRKLNPEGEKICLKRTSRGMPIERFDSRLWYYANTPWAFGKFFVLESELKKIHRSFKKSLQPILADGREGEETSYVEQAHSEISFESDIPLKYIDEWNAKD